ncbi:MAG TPA: ABC transporter permease [Flavisolibacter sp.]|nr:ABC transporter permease [Flavisolibacter sp.]
MFTHLPFILRRFSRQKLTTSFHIVGLTLGITVCLLIGLFIRHELSFDAYHSKAARIYRVNQVWADFGKKEFHYSTPFPLADAIRKDVTGVEHVTKLHHPFNSIIQISAEKRFKQDHVMMTDPEFFDVFDVNVVQGDPRQTLSKPYQAVLTESTARKFFGNENPVGKTFKYNNEFEITVGAVISDFPGNTHLPAALILSFAANEKYLGTSMTQYGSVSGGTTFILLPEGKVPTKGLKKSLRSIYDRSVNNEPWMKERKGSYQDVELQPLSDIHFNAKYAGGGEWVKAINTSWLWFFGSVGLAVLLLACINFINLSTAQALTRAKEVGVRKTIGAAKFQLIGQFLEEALLLVFIAAGLGIVVTKILLPYINRLVEKQISFDLFRSPSLLLSLVAGIVVTALMAGLYPAWLISKFQPAATLKSGPVNSGAQSALLRKGLVVAQFTISICLLIGVLLIGRQMNYIRSKNLGFDKENVLTIPLPEGNTVATEAFFRNELSEIPAIKDVSFSTASFNGDNWGTIMSLTDGKDPNNKPVTLMLVDERYCEMYGFNLKEGRFLTLSDTNSVSQSIPEGRRYAKSVVNETLVKSLGFESAQAALGKQFWIGMNGWKADIVGVVEDFNTSSLHDDIRPTLITIFPPFTNKAGIKLRTGANLPSAIANINSAFKKVFPDGVFEFKFLDEQIDALYRSEERLYVLFKIFSLVAMLISCIGLWGLVNFAAERRVKEIGIRKVLGASVSNIVALLTKDFLILVSVAIVIASPLAYWGIHRWLQDFAYRTSIDWTVFIVAGFVAVIIALLTVSVQALKAAVASPVKNLRTE